MSDDVPGQPAMAPAPASPKGEDAPSASRVPSEDGAAPASEHPSRPATSVVEEPGAGQAPPTPKSPPAQLVPHSPLAVSQSGPSAAASMVQFSAPSASGISAATLSISSPTSHVAEGATAAVSPHKPASPVGGTSGAGGLLSPVRSGAGLQDEEVPATPTYDAALIPSRPGLSVSTEVSAAIPSPKPQQQSSTVHVESAPGSPAVTSSGGGVIDPAPAPYPSSSSGDHASGASGSSNQVSGGGGGGSGGIGSGGGSEGGGYLAGLTARRYLDQYITPVLREALKELVQKRPENAHEAYGIMIRHLQEKQQQIHQQRSGVDTQAGAQ